MTGNFHLGALMNEKRFGAAAIAVFLWAGMAAEAGAQGVHYVSLSQPGFARAFCASGMSVLGGGGFVEADPPGARAETSLRYSVPIRDASGRYAWGTMGSGWQIASADFTGDVRAFVVCADYLLSAALPVQYVLEEATGMARAYCPAGTKVIGGGGSVNVLEKGVSIPVHLRQTYPISDETGVIAFGSNAIGWQAASSDFAGTVVAFAVCAAVGKRNVEYRSAQATGVARASCPAGTSVTGGGGFVETSPFAPVALRHTHPISDATGRIASDRTAIGWQAASSDFNDTVVAFAVCLSGS